MIEFKDILETRVAMKDAKSFKEKVCNVEASFNYMDKINSTTAAQMNSLFARFYNKPKKAVVHTWIKSNRYNSGGQKIELQMSKSGIGATYAGGRIDVYRSLIVKDSYYGVQGLVKDVIEDKEVYDKSYEFVSDKGKGILKALKDAVEKTKIEHPEATTIKYNLTLTEDEKKCFGIKEQQAKENIHADAYIEIKDDYKQMTMEVKSEYAKNHGNNNYSNNDELFKVNELNLKDEKDFQYFMFIHYHLNDFEKALNEYKETTKDHKERWTKFKEIMNEKLAKYIILYKM